MSLESGVLSLESGVGASYGSNSEPMPIPSGVRITRGT